MPIYDVTLWDFLKFASDKNTSQNKSDFFPLIDRIEMALRICDGLIYLNTQWNVAHRDIKPDNIFVNVNPHSHTWKKEDPKSVVITDFGISASMNDSINMRNRGSGTPGWSPPEQFLCNDSSW